VATSGNFTLAIDTVEGARELVISRTPHIVAYHIRNNIVEILAVKHGAQEWPTQF